jgi:hypothetical protein
MSLIHKARGVAVALGALLMSGLAHASPEQDCAAVAALDTEYQAAVERNDAEGMARILHPEMILVVGRGLVFAREDLLRSAREQEFVYEHQVEEEGTQTVPLRRRHRDCNGAALVEGDGPKPLIAACGSAATRTCARRRLALRIRSGVAQPAAAAIGASAGASLRLKVRKRSHITSAHWAMTEVTESSQT